MASKYIVHFHGNSYETYATSAAQAINNVRYREHLRYAPMSSFVAKEVGK